MKYFESIRHVRHTAQNMFDLVADVGSYPEFVPLCAGLSVRSREAMGANEVLVTDMTVAYNMLRDTFTSRVTLDRSASVILVEYLDGPFRMLHNRWEFKDTGEGRSDVVFFIEYELKSRALQIIAGSVFDKAFRKFALAFEIRADTIYGQSPAKPLSA